MAGIFGAGAVQAIDWPGLSRSAWEWGKSSSSSTTAFLIGLPRECRLAITHTAAVCMMQDPQYYSIPGFAPLGASWGWLLLGSIAGCTLTVLILSLCGCLAREPTMQTVASVMQPAGNREEPNRQRARQDILSYLASGGPSALQDLTAATGLSEQEFLMHVLGGRAGAQQGRNLEMPIAERRYRF